MCAYVYVQYVCLSVSVYVHVCTCDCVMCTIVCETERVQPYLVLHMASPLSPPEYLLSQCAWCVHCSLVI